MLKEMDKIIGALLFLSAIDVCYWKIGGIRNGVRFPGSYCSTIATTPGEYEQTSHSSDCTVLAMNGTGVRKILSTVKLDLRTPFEVERRLCMVIMKTLHQDIRSLQI